LFDQFSHADINIMCCLHRLKDLKLDSILEMNELKNTNRYWSQLKLRASYSKGILGFMDHQDLLEDAFPSGINPHLEKLKEMISANIN